MEVRIRDVDPIVVKKIDEMAKKKSISRNKFLASIIEKIAYEDGINEKDARLEMIISSNTQAMKEMNNSVARLENLITDLLEE